MRLTVQLFARARDLAGSDRVTVELPDGATVADLRQRLGEQFPALASLLPRSAIAADRDFAADDRVLAPGTEVALIPPVSGG